MGLPLKWKIALQGNSPAVCYITDLDHETLVTHITSRHPSGNKHRSALRQKWTSGATDIEEFQRWSHEQWGKLMPAAHSNTRTWLMDQPCSTNSIWLLLSFMLHGVDIVKGESRPNSRCEWRELWQLIQLVLLRLAPAWKKAAENLKGLVKVAAIDCDEEANKPTCGQYGIQGFPTIKIFSPSSDKKSAKRPSGKLPAPCIINKLRP